MDPVTLISLIAAVTQLIQMGVQGSEKLAELFPEWDRFWELFEQQLRDTNGVSPSDLDDLCFRDPAFRALAIAFIGGDPEARAKLDQHFRSVVAGETYVARLMAAAEVAASEAPTADRRAALASRRFILERIAEGERGVREALRSLEAKTDQVVISSREAMSAAQEGVDEIRQVRLVQEADSVAARDKTALDSSEFRALNDKVDDVLSRLPAAPLPVDSVPRAEVDESELAILLSGDAMPLELIVERQFRLLAAADEDAALRVRAMYTSGGVGHILRALRRGDLDQDPAVLVCAARVVLTEGHAADAERAFVRAGELEAAPYEAARQLVRAASMASLQGESEREAFHTDGARAAYPQHPLLAVIDARASDDAERALKLLEDVQPITSSETAAVHIARGQAHLGLRAVHAAGRELALAQQADAADLSVREFQAVLAAQTAQLEIAEGRRPDHRALVAAARRFTGLANELEVQGRVAEAALLYAHAADALVVVGQRDRAVETLMQVRQFALLPLGSRVALARASLMCQRPDLAVGFLPEESDDAQATLARAEALILGGDEDERNPAIQTLTGLLDAADDDVVGQAAFALLSAAAFNVDIDWNERAAEIVKARSVETEAAFRAERFVTQDDIVSAEDALLPHADRAQALRRLRDYAGKTGDWRKVEDRSLALMQLDANPSDRLAYADALRHLGRPAEALVEGLRVARDDAADEQLRDAAFALSMGLATKPRDYVPVRELATEWLASVPASGDARWNLAFAHARLSDHSKALELLRNEPLSGITQQRALLLGEVLHKAAPAEEAVSRLIALSDHFERSVEGLEALIIATSAGRQVALPDETGKRVGATYAEFEARFPDSTTIRSFPSPSTAQELETFLKTMLGDRPARQLDAAQAIADGRAPVQVLAALSSGGVGATWDVLRHLPLSFSDERTDTVERAVAASAIGGAVVLDPSSIHVLTCFSPQVEQQIVAKFPGAMIVTETLEDADGPDLSGPVDAEHGDADEAVPESRRLRSLHLAKSLVIRGAPVDDLEDESAEELATAYADGDLASEVRTVFATLLLARSSGRSLYSDDRWIRAAATALGVNTFGTLALLDALHDRSLLGDQERRDARTALAVRSAWGLRYSADELIAEARRSGFAISDAIQGAFQDRAVWREVPAHRAQDFGFLFEAVHAEQPTALAQWTREMLAAAAGAVPEMHKSWFAELLLMMAWVPHSGGPTLSDECFRAMVDVVKRLPPSHTTLSYDAVLGALSGILEVVEDQTNDIRFGFFRQVARRLGAVDQYRAITTFVKFD